MKEDGETFYCVDDDDDGYKGKGRIRVSCFKREKRGVLIEEREREMRMPQATCCSSLRSLSLSLSRLVRKKQDFLLKK